MSGNRVNMGKVTAKELSDILWKAADNIPAQIRAALASEGLKTIREIEKSTPADTGMQNISNRMEVSEEGPRILLRFRNTHEYAPAQQDDMWFNHVVEMMKSVQIPFIMSLQRTYEAVLSVLLRNISGG